jgi:DNA-binding FrmR family transcriptional regulator
MINRKESYFDVIIQTKSIKASYEKAMIEFLCDNMNERIVNTNKKYTEKIQKLLREIMKK